MIQSSIKPTKPTLRVAIQEYNHATKSYRGRKSYLVRLGSKSEIKAFLEKFAAFMNGESK